MGMYIVVADVTDTDILRVYLCLWEFSFSDMIKALCLVLSRMFLAPDALPIADGQKWSFL